MLSTRSPSAFGKMIRLDRTCEARMHSATTTPEHRFDFRSAAASIAVLMLAGAMLAGCRSSRPSGSMVQVTEEPAAVAATLPAPEQRLATSRIGKAKPAADGQ